MRVGFDPDAEQDRARQITSRLIELSGRHHDLNTYDQLEVHLIWFRSVSESKTFSITRNVAELERSSEDGESERNDRERLRILR